MSDLNNTSYALRSKTCKRKHPEEVTVSKRRLRSFDPAPSLPNEMLLYIFSFLDINDLYYNVRKVCPRWNLLAMSSWSWKKITVGPEVPTEVLLYWIQFSPVIRHLHLDNRTDVEIILKAVSKYARQLESLRIENGWINQIYIRSKALCNLVTRCTKLNKFYFENIKIRSCKFFDLLEERRRRGELKQLRYIE